jgi:hypothetical protein
LLQQKLQARFYYQTFPGNLKSRKKQQVACQARTGKQRDTFKQEANRQHTFPEQSYQAIFLSKADRLYKPCEKESRQPFSQKRYGKTKHLNKKVNR